MLKKMSFGCFFHTLQQGCSIKQHCPSHLINETQLIVLCGNQLPTKTLVNLHSRSISFDESATYPQYLPLQCLPPLFIFHYRVLSKILSAQHYKDSIHTKRPFSKHVLVFFFEVESPQTSVKL